MWKRWLNKIKGHKLFVGLIMVVQLLWQGSKTVGQIADFKLLMDIILEYSAPVLKVVFSPPGAIITFVGGFLYFIWDSRANRKQAVGTPEDIRQIEKEKLQKELRDAAERNRQILISNQLIKPAPIPEIKIPPPVLPLLSEIRTTPTTFRYENWIVIGVQLENTTDIPLPCKISIEEAKLWSKNRFVGRSSLTSVVELNSPKVLEPDVPVTIRMLASIRKPTGEPVAIFIESANGRKRFNEQDGIYIFILRVESRGRYKTLEVFVKWEKEKSFEWTGDPRKQLSSN